jgi:hypothetical protein
MELGTNVQNELGAIQSLNAKNQLTIDNLRELWSQVFRLNLGKNSNMTFSPEGWNHITIRFYNFGMVVSARKEPKRWSADWFCGASGETCGFYVREESTFEKQYGSFEDCTEVMELVLQFLQE